MIQKPEDLISAGTGVFKEANIKTVFMKKQLIERYKTTHIGFHVCKIMRKNLLGKKLIRAGMIRGKVQFEDTRRRWKRSLQSLITIKQSKSDIIFDDALWKIKRNLRRTQPDLKEKSRRIYKALRGSYLKLIKSRENHFFTVITNCKKSKINIISYLNTNKFRHAETTANAAVRKIQQKYSLFSTFFPFLKRRKSFISGFFVFWNGRYSKKQRVSETAFNAVLCHTLLALLLFLL